MKFYKSDWIVAIAVAVALLGGKIDLSGIFTPTPAPVVVVAIDEPTAAMKAVVQPVAALVTGTNATVDRAALSEFYLAWGDMLQRDALSKKVTTTLALHDANVSSGLLMFQQTGIQGRYATLAEQINKTLAAWVGLLDANGKVLNVPFDDAKRAKAVEYCKGLAWALNQSLLANPKG